MTYILCWIILFKIEIGIAIALMGSLISCYWMFKDEKHKAWISLTVSSIVAICLILMI